MRYAQLCQTLRMAEMAFQFAKPGSSWKYPYLKRKELLTRVAAWEVSSSAYCNHMIPSLNRFLTPGTISLQNMG